MGAKVPEKGRLSTWKADPKKSREPQSVRDAYDQQQGGKK
jgi:hypothetical protein